MSDQSEGRMSEATQVYVCTSGEYSDYGIVSIWLTLEEAQAQGSERVEVWPIGDNERTLGDFSRSGDFDAITGEAVWENVSDGPDIPEEEGATVLCWAGRKTIGIRVSARTQERANKIYSEVRARVLNDITMGLPPEVIADKKYTGAYPDPWVAIQK